MRLKTWGALAQCVEVCQVALLFFPKSQTKFILTRIVPFVDGFAIGKTLASNPQRTVFAQAS